MEYVIILGVILVLIVMFVISTNNALVKLRNMVRNQWSQIEVHLTRRASLIPNLVETVKGYAKHESETFEAVISARNKATSATTPHDQMAANNELTGALSKMMLLVEAYPELKANENFMRLQNDLKDTEDKVAFARQFYNDAVNKYNDKLEMFPSNIVASMFKFEKAEFFKALESEREVPKVQF